MTVVGVQYQGLPTWLPTWLPRLPAAVPASAQPRGEPLAADPSVLCVEASARRRGHLHPRPPSSPLMTDFDAGEERRAASAGSRETFQPRPQVLAGPGKALLALTTAKGGSCEVFRGRPAGLPGGAGCQERGFLFKTSRPPARARFSTVEASSGSAFGVAWARRGHRDVLAQQS